jgi:hypothetical protein
MSWVGPKKNMVGLRYEYDNILPDFHMPAQGDGH